MSKQDFRDLVLNLPTTLFESEAKQHMRQHRVWVAVSLAGEINADRLSCGFQPLSHTWV